jgi:hypothetical protein
MAYRRRERATSVAPTSDISKRGKQFMKQFAATMLLVAGLCLVGCSANNSLNPANINGTWNATLTDTNNTTTVFTFGTSLMVNSDGSLSVSNFTFTTSSPCFLSGETESGSFTLSGNFNGNVTGKFQFVVLSGNPSGNTLALSGTANGNTISGTWTLNGSSCTGNGNFMMTRV